MNPAQQKIIRMRAALAHREADRVPIGEAFWTGFLQCCQDKWGSEFDPNFHFDLDYVVVLPNMDPHIQPFEILSQDGYNIRLKTGFGATIRRTGSFPMPHFEGFSVSRPEQMADFEFQSATDARRFHQAGDDQLNGVGDALSRNTPAWEDRLQPYLSDFAVFGGTCEPYEYLWRIIGSENALVWMASERERFEAFVNRVGEWLLDFTRAEIEAGRGRLSGMMIYGDVAYRRGMLFSPRRWRELFKPHVKALIDLCHAHDLMVIYHGCGNARAIYDDLAELGLDAYNPLEAKADLDVVQLKKEYAGRLAFVGNIDVRVLERGNPDEIRHEVLYKLQAAQGGGWVFQSDHSITSDVAPESYALALQIVREHGCYPLAL